jgi:hypothetical protein
MNLSTHNLILAADAPIDLQLHTTNSDGVWQPAVLLDYLVGEDFSLVAITDHDRVDTITALQSLAIAKQLPVIVATEMSTRWRDQSVDVLCYGVDPNNHSQLSDLTGDILSRQQENTRVVYDHLRRDILADTESLEAPDELLAILDKPSAQQPPELAQLLQRWGVEASAVWPTLMEAGVRFETNTLAEVVDAAHHSGAVCLIAHPGRGEFFMQFDVPLLDQLRQQVPIDGLEAHYPKHTSEQTRMFLDYAQAHDLLVSAGSDSHRPDNPPIKYPAHLCANLLERLGIRVHS